MKILKHIKKFALHQAVWITILSILSFVVPTLIDAYLRKTYDFSFENRQLLNIGFSLLVIFLNLLIVKRWLSFDRVGLRKKGFIRSLLYSLTFIVLLRVIDFFGYREVFPKEIWTKQFLLYLTPFVFLAFQEELMFRGIIFGVWERWKGFLVALFVSSILFGLEHLLYPALGFEYTTTSRAVTTALWAPVFATIVYRTGNIWGLAIGHFLYNASITASESVNQSTQALASIEMLSVGIYLFLPIAIDKIDQRLSGLKKTKIVWSRYLATLFIGSFLLISSWAISEDLGLTEEKEFCPVLENEAVKECIEKIKPVKDDCYGIDLQLGKAKERVKGSEKALELLQDNCLWILDAQFHDLTGDGNQELVMIASGVGCASCHWNRLYILKDEQLIFEKDTEDVAFWPGEDYHGFTIMYPLRRFDEPYCCPTEGIIESYQVWEGEYQYFYKFDERSERYKE